MIRRDFHYSILVVKEFLDTLSEDEERELLVWKASHESLYRRLRKSETLEDHISKLNEFSAEEAWRVMDKRVRRTAIRRKLAIAAAVLLPLLLFSGIYVLQIGPNEEPSPVYAVVETKCGEVQLLVLPDGTQVHLSAMSRLVYPESFTADERRIELEGEAFFDVTSSDIPFIVSTRTMEIEVLGTVFNVSAYTGESANAVLVEGSVKVSGAESSGCLLSPGQKATILEETGDITVESVETDIYTSWTHGRIQFRDERLEDIMKEMSRWYDFKVEYEDEYIKELRFGGCVSRYDSIEPFMDLLIRTGRVSIKKKDNNYIIY